MASLLKKHGNLIGRSVVRLQENVRLEVPHEYLDQYIRLTKEYVSLVPTELLFKINEGGFSDWEERKPNSPLDIGLLCYAAGDVYRPLLVSSDPAARALFEH
jgi:hypothetical protein